MKRFTALLFSLTLLASTSFAGLTIVTPAIGSMGTNVDTVRATVAAAWIAGDVSSTTHWSDYFDTANRIQAIGGYSDSYGKAYHYYIGCASNSAQLFSCPIDVAGYKSATVQVLSSTGTAGVMTAAYQVLNMAPSSVITASLWGTPYPYDFVLSALANSSLSTDAVKMGITQIPQDFSWDPVHASSSAVIAGASATGLETVTTTGAANAVTTTTAGLKQYNISGLSKLYVGFVMGTPVVNAEVIIRIYK